MFELTIIIYFDWAYISVIDNHKTCKEMHTIRLNEYMYNDAVTLVDNFIKLQSKNYPNIKFNLKPRACNFSDYKV